jgi:integrase
MTMKEGKELVATWLKAELDDYADMQSGIRRGLDRIRPAQPAKASAKPETLDLDDTSSAKTGPVGVMLIDGARTAILELGRTEGFRPKRRNDYQNAVDSFIAWNGGDIDLAHLTPELVGEFKSALTHYPARGSVRPAYRDLTWKERVAHAREIKETDVLNAETINTKYLGPLRSIFRYHQGVGLKHKLPTNPFDGIAARKKRTAKRDSKRREFTAREVRTMLAQPMFTGAKGTSLAPLYQRGDVRISDWRYWVPLISLFTGARLNEVCAIALNDFRIEGGIHFVLIRDVLEEQHGKSDAAWRRVPLHRELVRLRLPDYVEQRRLAGGVRLFDDLEMDAFGYVSGRPSKFFNRLVDTIADPDPENPGKLVFYSTRHTVIGRLRSADVRMDVAKEIVGHEDGDVHSGYGHIDLKGLKVAVDKIEYDGLDLTAVELPEHILPKSKS